jgi:hypothetical protein
MHGLLAPPSRMHCLIAPVSGFHACSARMKYGNSLI